jgi:hypothetical protein
MNRHYDVIGLMAALAIMMDPIPSDSTAGDDGWVSDWTLSWHEDDGEFGFTCKEKTPVPGEDRSLLVGDALGPAERRERENDPEATTRGSRSDSPGERDGSYAG